jgi:hypothetical protein
MIVPGVTKTTLSKLKKEDSKAVERHLKTAKEAIKLKNDLMDGKLEELGEYMQKPRQEIKQITTLIEEIEDEVNPDLLTLLLSLEVNARELEVSIDEEAKLLKNLRGFSGKTGFKQIQKQMEGEAILAWIIEHQLNVLVDIRTLSRSIIKQAKKLRRKELKNRIAMCAQNMDDIASYLSKVILREELPHLTLAYSALQLEEWPELQERLVELKKRYEVLEPKILR